MTLLADVKAVLKRLAPKGSGSALVASRIGHHGSRFGSESELARPLTIDTTAPVSRRWRWTRSARSSRESLAAVCFITRWSRPRHAGCAGHGW